MDKNNNSTEAIEYKEIVDQIKREYKSKIENVIQSAKKQMSKEAAGILGHEFAQLLSKRKELVDCFGKNAKVVLNFAVKNGMATEIKQLGEWSKTVTDKNNLKKSEGNKLFEALVDKIEQINPSITSPLRDSESELVANNRRLNEVVQSKKIMLKQLEKEHRENLQKQIIELVLEFNKKILVVNKSFGIEGKKSIHSLDLKTDNVEFDVTEEIDEEIYIPAGNDDIIN
ncbi:MAG: hypothetical protein IJA15_00960 [Clostridia bacterium]|nr:hypothetical protein [Clostridia bacterium]